MTSHKQTVIIFRIQADIKIHFLTDFTAELLGKKWMFKFYAVCDGYMQIARWFVMSNPAFWIMILIMLGMCAHKVIVWYRYQEPKMLPIPACYLALSSVLRKRLGKILLTNQTKTLDEGAERKIASSKTSIIFFWNEFILATRKYGAMDGNIIVFVHKWNSTDIWVLLCKIKFEKDSNVLKMQLIDLLSAST